ncbi:hypothetical protein FRX31_004438 [Thalictrum thalictroides]|uniref:Uncharacterized protein n=1 Tax=Thalictrum thalictroides TaxID=46969 RepID=A0A7J6X861_THATH|nr:hypothetical protein FRX31_004438 [Thalictrum thalictroides]
MGGAYGEGFLLLTQVLWRVCLLRLGTGEALDFGLTNGAGKQFLLLLYRQAILKEGVVADHLQEVQWNLRIRRRRPRGEEAHEWEAILAFLRNVVVNDDDDNWI